MSHREMESTEDYQNKTLVGTEAPSVRRATEIVCQFCQQFIYKAFIPKGLSEICTLHLRRSLCHRHLRDIAFSSVLSISMCALLYKRFSLSLHISEEPKTYIHSLYFNPKSIIRAKYALILTTD